MRWLLMLVIAWSAFAATASDELRAFYEQRKKEIAPTFKAPALGSQVEVVTASGQTRQGILMKLDAESISLMTDNGALNFKRMAIKESSRALFFADDFAHIRALEEAKAYKSELHKERLAEAAAGVHDGRVSVSAKVEKDSDKFVEEEETENERTGTSMTTTTTTRSFSEIQRLKVTVSNVTTHPDTYALEWYFFGQAMRKSASEKEKDEPLERKIVVHDGGTKRVTVGARQRATQELESEAFIVEKVAVVRVSSDHGNSPDPRVSEAGMENAGWLVLLKYDGEILDSEASSRKFLEPEWIEGLQLP